MSTEHMAWQIGSYTGDFSGDYDIQGMAEELKRRGYRDIDEVPEEAFLQLLDDGACEGEGVPLVVDLEDAGVLGYLEQAMARKLAADLRRDGHSEQDVEVRLRAAAELFGWARDGRARLRGLVDQLEGYCRRSMARGSSEGYDVWAAAAEIERDWPMREFLDRDMGWMLTRHYHGV